MTHRTAYIVDGICLIILIFLLGGSVYYVWNTRPCAQPIQYKVGTFDTRFGISQADFLTDAQTAANLWNTEAGHTVLEYSPTAKMPLNLIYDNRQLQTNIGQDITQQEAQLATEKNIIAEEQAQYDTEKQKYESDKAAGVSVDTINSEITALNALATKIQTDVNTLNSEIDIVNSNATAYNTQAGTDFEEGEYVEEYGVSRIDLYEFKNNTQLIRLMAHEFGHSLGLAHNQNPQSIMYPENIATTLELSPDDKAELQARCAATFTNLNPFQNLKLPGFVNSGNLGQ